MNVVDCLNHLVKQFKYEEYLNTTTLKDVQERIENVQELINNATDFGSKGGTLDKYLQNIMLITASDNENNDNAVSLQTIHSMKGGEKPIIFSIGVEEGLMPHRLALAEEDTQDGLEEERRVLYVSLTRCQSHLFVSYCENRKFRDNRGNLQYKRCKPSRFLFEAELLKTKEDYV